MKLSHVLAGVLLSGTLLAIGVPVYQQASNTDTTLISKLSSVWQKHPADREAFESSLLTKMDASEQIYDELMNTDYSSVPEFDSETELLAEETSRLLSGTHSTDGQTASALSRELAQVCESDGSCPEFLDDLASTSAELQAESGESLTSIFVTLLDSTLNSDSAARNQDSSVASQPVSSATYQPQPVASAATATSQSNSSSQLPEAVTTGYPLPYRTPVPEETTATRPAPAGTPVSVPSNSASPSNTGAPESEPGAGDTVQPPIAPPPRPEVSTPPVDPFPPMPVDTAEASNTVYPLSPFPEESPVDYESPTETSRPGM